MALTARSIDDSCPMCGAHLDAHTDALNPLDPDPVPGDVSVCFYCAGILKFGDDLRLRRPTVDELVALPWDVWRVQAAALGRLGRRR